MALPAVGRAGFPRQRKLLPTTPRAAYHTRTPHPQLTHNRLRAVSPLFAMAAFQPALTSSHTRTRARKPFLATQNTPHTPPLHLPRGAAATLPLSHSTPAAGGCVLWTSCCAFWFGQTAGLIGLACLSDTCCRPGLRLPPRICTSPLPPFLPYGCLGITRYRWLNIATVDADRPGPSRRFGADVWFSGIWADWGRASRIHGTLPLSSAQHRFKILLKRTTYHGSRCLQRPRGASFFLDARGPSAAYTLSTLPSPPFSASTALLLNLSHTAT